jgi:hypothetical protein
MPLGIADFNTPAGSCACLGLAATNFGLMITIVASSG